MCAAAYFLARLRLDGFAVVAADDKLAVTPASMLTDDLRSMIRAHKAELIALLAAAEMAPQDRPYRLAKFAADAAHGDPWDDAAIARFQARAGHLRRLGFGEHDSDDLAGRLHLRDVHADYRHLCLECRHYRPRRCGSHRAAGLTTRELARDLATMFQDCPGFSEVL